MTMSLKKILVRLNKGLTVITAGLVFLFVSIPFSRKGGRLLRVPLLVNVIVITILLLIIAAFGGAFSKNSSEHNSAMVTNIADDDQP
jgi:hypothetical protein